MLYRFLADFVLVSHLAFVAFALFGGIFALRYPAMLWVHLTAVCWGVVVQWTNWICPLTPLENYFRTLGGEAGYPAGFIEHFVMKVLYPDALTLELRYVLGLALITVNLCIYAYVLRRKRTPDTVALPS